MKSREPLFVWERECDWSAGEVDERERERGAGGVESVGAADDQLDLVVQRFGAGVAEIQAAGVYWPGDDRRHAQLNAFFVHIQVAG